MKNRKAKKISGYGETFVDDLIDGGLTGVGMIAAHELKSAIMEDYIYSNTDTPEDKVMKNRVANVVGIAIGAGIPMLIDDRDTKRYVKSFGLGFAGQCLYALYADFRNEGQTAPTIAKGWNSKAYQDAVAKLRAKRGMAGGDNASPGLMGSVFKVAGGDNASPGLFGSTLKMRVAGL